MSVLRWEIITPEDFLKLLWWQGGVSHGKEFKDDDKGFKCFILFFYRMSTFTVRSGQVPTGARKVYSSGGGKRPSGYHLGKPADAIESSKGPSDAAPYKNQRYNDIKSKCLKDGTLFEDPLFPAVESSLFFSGKKPPRPFVWKRPKVYLI